jgi:hypothetical protein
VIQELRDADEAAYREIRNDVGVVVETLNAKARFRLVALRSLAIGLVLGGTAIWLLLRKKKTPGVSRPLAV